MLFLTLLTAAGFTAIPTGAVAVPRQDADQICHIELTVHVVTITDVTTDTTTQCYGQRGPCAYSTPEPPPEKPLDKDHPAECDDPSFSFYVTSWQYVSNYSIVVSHAVDGGVHTGPSGPLDYETYRDSFHESCAASGFCDAVIINATNPIVIPFA
ncbi:hypothetical protein MGN70_007508 [Eutypa lata]|nr:hypothetical protein MGN70_007508 [Eutypa lata]